MYKKIVSSVIVSLIAVCAVGCGNNVTTENKNDKINVICTIFPEYDWTREIAGADNDDVNITYLLGNGSDLHNYQPSADDMIRISDCDVFMYVGGESDYWVDEALAEAQNKNMKVIKLMDIVNAREEEFKEGMQAEEEEDSVDAEPEYDEHVWLSVKNAESICNEITDTLCTVNPENAAKYRANFASYTKKLSDLDKKFTDLSDSAKLKTVVFADRFPFRYFVEDYGFDYYAAFVGCSTETKASFKTIAFLADKVDSLGTDTVFTIEGSDCSIADAVVSNTKNKDQKTVVLDSIQSVDNDMINSGKTYLSSMENNYDLLKEALN